jgi:hypothetical protein
MTPEKNAGPTQTEHTEHMGGVNVIQQVHTDGTVDYVDTHAVGGDIAQMPDGYFRSMSFIMTVVVCSLHTFRYA